MPPSTILPSSQLEVSLHPPELLELVDIPVTRSLIAYVVDCTAETVDHAIVQSPHFVPVSQASSHLRNAERTAFAKFATQVLTRACIKVPVMLGTLVYIHRAKRYLDIANDHWAYERTFLGALILANKFLNDSTLKNVHWARCSGVFRIRDIGRIEREFLDVLDYNLSITESEILAHHSSIMALIHPHTRKPIVPQRVSRPTSWHSDITMSSNDSGSDSTTPSSSPRTPPAINRYSVGVNHERTSYSYPTRPKARPDSVASLSSFSSRPHHSHHHSRITESAIQILRSIPVPHFHHHNDNRSSRHIEFDLEPGSDGSGSSSSSSSSSSSIATPSPSLVLPPTRNILDPGVGKPPSFPRLRSSFLMV